MDYQNYKIEFVNWLKSQPGYDEENTVNNFGNNNFDINIFAHSDEFKKFLHEEKHIDSSVLNMNLSEILIMDVVDGQLVKNEETKSDEESDSEDESNTDNIKMSDKEDVTEDTFIKEDGNTTPSDEEQGQGESEFNFALQMLNDFLDEDIVKQNLDFDKNGKIDKMELEIYLNMLDKDGELTFDELVDAFKEMQDNTPKKDGDNEIEKIQENEQTQFNTNPQNTLQMTNPIQHTSSFSGSSGGASYNGGSVNRQSKMSTYPLDKMSIDELKDTKASKENEIDATNEQIDSVLNGKDDETAKNQADIDNKKDAFKESLIDNEKLDAQQAEIVANMTSIKNEICVLSERQDIIDKMISTQNQAIQNDESYISSLNDTLNNLPEKGSQDYPEDSKKAVKIEERRSALQDMIDKAKERLEKDKSVLKDREKEKEETQNQITNKKDELKSLEQQSGINLNDLKLSQETMSKSKEYTDAESKVETAKNKKLSTLQQNLKTQQQDLTNIDNKITDKAKTAYSPTLSVLPENLFKGDLAGKEDLVCELADKYGLDPVLVASVIILESGWGEAQAAQNNFMGYTGSGDIPSYNNFGAFSSIEAGLEAGIKNLSEYAERYPEVYAVDYDNLDAIGAHYCPGGSWPDKIRAVYDTVLSRMQ